MPKKGEPVRPIVAPGLSGKRFRSRLIPNRRVTVPPHPLVVVLDLRQGSLNSLNAYLKKHRGIPDREVALELRKLLSGSAARTKFRLIVVDHPDATPPKGGRPTSKNEEPTEQYVDLVEEYRVQFDAIGKIELAREETAKVFGVSVSTVSRAIKKVEVAESEERKWQELADRCERALEKLRRER